MATVPVSLVTTTLNAVYASLSGQSIVQVNVGFAVLTIPEASVAGDILPGETGTGSTRFSP